MIESTNGHANGSTHHPKPPFTQTTLAREAWAAYQEFKSACAPLRPPSQQAQDIVGAMQDGSRQREAWTWDAKWNDPVEMYFDALGTSASGWPGNYPLMQNPVPPVYQLPMKRGEDLPVYLTEEILRIIRENQRFVIANSPYAQAALENRINYTVGTGFTYTVEPKDGYADQVPDGEVKNAQRLIDLFVEYNAMESREAESQLRTDIEGEFFIRLFEGEDGMLKVRFVEPDLVRAPGGDYSPADSFGIYCDRFDVEDVKGYGVVYDPLNDGYQPTFVPEREMIHYKRNNFASAKRGRPLFYQCEQGLIRATQIMRSLSAMARARAKMALIRRLKGIAPTSAQSLVQSVTSTGTATAPVAGPPPNIEQWADGTIVTADDRTDYEYPDAHLNPETFVNVIHAELQAVAARAVIPEWMLTGSTENMAAFTAAAVADAPSTKSFTRNQSLLCGYFGEFRVGIRRSLCHRFLWHCVGRGWIPQGIAPMLKIVCKPPSVSARNKTEEATLNEIYNRIKVKSVQTIREEQDLDNDVETKRIAEETAAGAGSPQEKPKPQIGESGQQQVDGQRFGVETAQAEAVDASGHEHKGEGPGGGQFVKGGGGGSAAKTKDKPATKKEIQQKIDKEKKLMRYYAEGSDNWKAHKERAEDLEKSLKDAKHSVKKHLKAKNNGQIVHHGTGHDFDKPEVGSYWSSNQDASKVYLYNADGYIHTGKLHQNAVIKDIGANSWNDPIVKEFLSKTGESDLSYQHFVELVESQKFRDFLIEKGYDVVRFEEESSEPGSAKNVYHDSIVPLVDGAIEWQGRENAKGRQK